MKVSDNIKNFKDTCRGISYGCLQNIEDKEKIVKAPRDVRKKRITYGMTVRLIKHFPVKVEFYLQPNCH